MDDMPRENSPKPGAVSNVLAGLLVLVVEDQPLIALDTESMLADIGASSVASFSSADHALVWLQSSAPGVAVLDVNLGGTSSFAIADELSLRGIPFAFTTGYADTVMIPSHFAHVPVVQKPYTPDSLGQALALCLTAAGNRA
jgi:CheY-like chemotaxis protein